MTERSPDSSEPIALAEALSTPASAASQPRTVDPAARRRTIVLALLGAGALLACIVRLFAGDGLAWASSSDVLAVRIDRVLIGATVGAGLAVAGVLLQALLRNPLASPYIVGVSSGAALGLMVAAVGWVGMLGYLAEHTAALAGALLTMAVVWLLAQKRGRIDPLGLLLVGVIVNAINGAAIMFINYLLPHGRRGELALWMLGYLNDHIGRWPVLVVLALTAMATFAAFRLGRAMDIATFSDAEAHALGLNLPRLRAGLFLLAGLLTSGCVVLAGPIGFVGLICPHFVRLLLGPAHRPLVLGSALAGITLVVGADAAVKLLDVGQGLMPIGVLTAMIGGPVFLLMLRPHLGRGLGT